MTSTSIPSETDRFFCKKKHIFGRNKKIRTVNKCMTEDGKRGIKYIYVQSKSNSGLAQSFVSDISRFFKNF